MKAPAPELVAALASEAVTMERWCEAPPVLPFEWVAAVHSHARRADMAHARSIGVDAARWGWPNDTYRQQMLRVAALALAAADAYQES